MADMELLLSDPGAVEQYRAIVETALLVGGPLTKSTRNYLEQRSVELGVHRLDAEQVHSEVLAISSVQAAITIHTTRREQTQHYYETLRAELRAEQSMLETLAVRVSQSQSIIRLLQQRLATFNKISRLRDRAELVLIPAGEFKMGTEESYDEEALHNVYLDSYYIYKYPVTVKQYKQFCAATGYDMPDAPDFNANWSQEDHPIVNVSWDDATAYCEWAGVSLPTGAQWEKAARGVDGRRFPWGNEWDSNWCQCSKHEAGDAGGTASVGSFLTDASPYGVLDMAGNVLEWCSERWQLDWDSYYAAGPVLRGGSWFDCEEEFFRFAYRNWFAPEDSDPITGFRCVVSCS